RWNGEPPAGGLLDWKIAIVSIMILKEATFRTGTWVAIANIWFVTWAIRRRGELDENLDSTAKFIRWLVAILCLGTAIQLPQLLNPPTLRVCIGFVGVAFLVWPNLAYYLTRLLRRLRILPGHAPRGVNNPT